MGLLDRPRDIAVGKLVVTSWGMDGRVLGDCPDCAVAVGSAHDDGCDVARCAVTGWQRLGCDEDHDHGEVLWTGEWPGDVECREYGWDLNRLARAGATGDVVWSVERQRWVKPAS